MQPLALLIGLLLSFSVFAGSPFYLTAGRSFSTDEAPVIRLDYTDEQPMLVRVLKPEQLDSFLDGQFNISRSYEQPISELNPGYYFAKGLNGTESPLRLMRGLLAADFRKSLAGSPFSHALKNTGATTLASVPEQVLIAAPKGFKTVSEDFLDLTRNGSNAQDLSWWFEQDYYLRSRYKIRDIQLNKLPDGIYLVQAVQGKNEAQCLLQVSSLSVQVKQSGQQVLVRAIERGLTPVANATVSYRDGRGKWQVLADKTNAGGEVLFNNPEGILDGKLLVKVDAMLNQQTRTALTATDFLPAQDYERSVFVMTDRPIFKPGEMFFYKGIIRKAQDGQLQIPAIKNKQSKVSLLQADGRATGLTATAEVTDFATFSGSFALDNAQTPGLYRLLAEIDDKAYGGEFRVRDYQKPTFYLTELAHDSVITPGQAFKLNFHAKRYSGGIPQDVKFEVFLYRKKFEAPQFVEEAGLGLAAGPDYFGQIKSSNALSQPRRVFSSIEERQATELSNPWENAARLDDNGEGSFEFTVPMGTGEQSQQEWVYTLMVKAQDAAGSTAVLTENIYQTLSEAQPALRFSKTIAALGEKDLALLIQSSFADGKPAPYASGVIDVELTQPNTGKQALVKLPFKTDANGQQTHTLPAISGYGA
ncbi:MG2 domain-containing protein [Methylocucumis oryzae]|uniref:MG2 domain-containing protein n=1 Tax=Methylocucumis oryzae TaxID=1632867 RepID=UPI000695A8DF|nr:MG2 domain-containing protein [Methylocucumis oryzae]